MIFIGMHSCEGYGNIVTAYNYEIITPVHAFKTTDNRFVINGLPN
jgi:hypothetical protein